MEFKILRRQLINWLNKLVKSNRRRKPKVNIAEAIEVDLQMSEEEDEEPERKKKREKLKGMTLKQLMNEPEEDGRKETEAVIDECHPCV